VLGPVELVDSIDSTNRELADRARAGAPAGVVLVADHQTAGRGRLDRRWEAAPGASLLVSVLVRPDLPPERAHRASMAAGLAGIAACREVAGVETSLKWPNDLVVEEEGATAKLAGILCELVFDRSRLAAVVIGMGLNVAEGPHLPEGATCLQRLAGRPVARAEVLDAWLAALDGLLGRLDEPALLDEYRAGCTTLGRQVRLDTASGPREGVAADVTADGHLVLQTGAGPVTLAEGDVTHLRGFPTADGGPSSTDA
jgi:BirA family biotin operon repressor/biotin-[acetyl-CoA-carboxylase] ligase